MLAEQPFPHFQLCERSPPVKMQCLEKMAKAEKKLAGMHIMQLLQTGMAGRVSMLMPESLTRSLPEKRIDMKNLHLTSLDMELTCPHCEGKVQLTDIYIEYPIPAGQVEHLVTCKACESRWEDAWDNNDDPDMDLPDIEFDFPITLNIISMEIEICEQ